MTPTKEATALELEMLSKGYASSRMVAKKTKHHFASILRLLREGTIEGVTIGQQKFAKIESVKAYFGADAVRLLNLNDWGDAVTGL